MHSSAKRRSLKRIPQTNLANARARKSVQILRQNFTKTRSADLGVRSAEAVAIENVEHLKINAELARIAAEPHTLADAQIFGGDARVAKVRQVARRITKFSVRRIHNASRVEISAANLPVVVFAVITSRDDVGVDVIDPRIVGVGDDAHGHAGGVVKIAGDGPAADQRV